MNDNYIIVERIPTVAEYQKLREAVGWWSTESAVTETGLSNSLISVCVLSDGKVIGCGRIIGDGGIYFYIQDVIVLPEFQRQGIGESIMETLMEYLKASARTKAFIGLMTAKGSAGFYERFGFIERPSDAPGMYMVLER